MRYIKLFVLFFISFSFGMLVSSAETLECKEVSNGKIQMMLHSNRGYASAVDVMIKITGNVSFDHIEWDASLHDLAIHEYVYNESDQTVRMLLTTKHSNQNLLSQERVLTFGTLVMHSQHTESYGFEFVHLSMTDIDLDSTVISGLSMTGDSSFTYNGVGEEPNVPSVPEVPSDGNPSTPISPTLPNQTDTDSNLSNDSQVDSDINDGSDETDSSDSTVQKPNENDGDSNSSQKPTDDFLEKSESKGGISILIFVPIILIILFVLLIFYKKKKHY